jgi:hypothetical protein
MYDSTNIFDHERHVFLVTSQEQLQGLYPSNYSCEECHASQQPKNMQSAKDCLECHHEDMFLTANSEPRINSMYAVSFSDAMHSNCMDCHNQEAVNLNKDHLDKCYTCHKSLKKQNPDETRDLVETIRKTHDKAKNKLAYNK